MSKINTHQNSPSFYQLILGQYWAAILQLSAYAPMWAVHVTEIGLGQAGTGRVGRGYYYEIESTLRGQEGCHRKGQWNMCNYSNPHLLIKALPPQLQTTIYHVCTWVESSPSISFHIRFLTFNSFRQKLCLG